MIHGDKTAYELEDLNNKPNNEKILWGWKDIEEKESKCQKDGSCKVVGL